MSDATARNLAFAREAASVAAFRIIYVFCAFGAVELFATIVRLVLLALLAPPDVDSASGTSALSSPWGMACVGSLIAVHAMKLAMIVSVHRRRLVHPEPFALWVGLGLFGIAARIGASVVGYVQATWIARTYDVRTLAGWAEMQSAASIVGLLLDGAVAVTILVMAAQAVQRDRRRPDAPATYRSAGDS